MRSGLGFILCVFSLLAACGGDDGPAAPPPTSNNPPPAPPPAPPPEPVIGASGGTVTEVSGASVVIPPGALSADSTIRIARDSTGAPAIPPELTAAGNMYVITPHGGEFAEGVEVRIPVPDMTLQPNQEFKIAKAQPSGDWVVYDDTVFDQGTLSTTVDSFSFFTAIVVTYVLPIAQIPPLRMSTTLSCSNNQCIGLVGPVTATYTVVSNGGQAAANCPSYTLAIAHGASLESIGYVTKHAISNSGGSFTRTVNPGASMQYHFAVVQKCGTQTPWTRFGPSADARSVSWASWGNYPKVNVLRMPGQIDVVEGLSANVEAVLSGGASEFVPSPPSTSALPTHRAATLTDRALIDWQRSDDGGASWRVVAQSFQNEANPLPEGVGIAWRYWSVRHGFIASVTDQGALLRIRACYTPPTGAAPPCVTSSATRLNVLQQSGAPAIATAPRSVLVRTGQTASLTAVATGLPTPTLQWQSRAANSTGAWTDVTAGTGPTTANYTTAATALADNGAQYRIVATNAVGSAASSAVTVSVSDLDVAPSITTQPANLSVASGSDAVFAVDASGTEALSYQWYRNGIALAGENSPVLRLTSVSVASAGSFTVTVSNAAGDADSNAAVLNVYPGAPAAVAPAIVTQPASVTANAGSTATLAVGVDGTGPFSFQWRRDGVNVAGATSAVLTFNSVALPNAGSFSVVVTNSAGSVTSSNAVLDVVAAGTPTAPSITSQPATLIVPFMGAGVVAVGATGSGPLSYQWSKDGAELPGATLPVLDFSNVAEQSVGTYTVTVTNSMGSVTSNSASIILLGAPVITQQPADITVIEGANATFFVVANSTGLRYQWSVNGNPIPGAIAATWNTGPVVAANSGAVYSVMVYNGAGHVYSQSAVLTVQTVVAPTITQHPQSVTIQPGLQAEMCVAIGGTPTFDVQLQRWNGSSWTPGTEVLVNDNTEVCYFTPALTLADDGAQFRFLVDNPAGEVASNTATVTVETTTGPVITGTTLVSLANDGAVANNRSYSPSLSTDGNLVAFISDGTNLVPNFNGDAFTAGYAYVRNLTTGATTLINQTPAGARSSTGVNGLKLAAGGRYAVFTSLAGDLVADDTNGSQDVFVRDLLTNTTTRVSLRADGTQVTGAGNAQSDMQLDISADGGLVSFVSNQDLIDNGPAGAYALYLRSMQTGFLRRVFSSASALVSYPTLSADGTRMVFMYGTFTSPPENIIVYHNVESNSSSDLVSVDTSSGDYIGQGLSISADGRFVAFAVRAQAWLGSPILQVAVADLDALDSIAIASAGSVGSGIGAGNQQSSYPKLSDDGRYVLFSTMASNITENAAGLNNPVLLLRDLQTQTTSIAFRRFNGSPSHTGAYNAHAISGDGSLLAQTSGVFEMTGAGPPDYQVFMTPRP